MKAVSVFDHDIVFLISTLEELLEVITIGIKDDDIVNNIVDHTHLEALRDSLHILYGAIGKEMGDDDMQGDLYEEE